ncbi:hypothetical protein DY000_02004289 [Brassica cretica]|uniref:Uncharacterized protein n=1 Tax=Brassica cretica TaxID=69181 RepID=A0ABQ7CEY0_BRACR|nr:hypothetical protein DY000_02004289 [Brassica cretica]
MKQIRFKQKLLGKELISAIRSMLVINNRLTLVINNRSTLVINNRSTLVLNNRSTPTIPRRSTTVQCRKPLDPDDYAKEIDGRTLHVSREDIADILQTANGANNISVHNKEIRRLLERASREKPAYICLPEHASSFTQTKLVPEIYTKEVINEMFYGVCGEHERNKEAFQMKFDGVYYPLNDSISWLTTFMEEMKQGIARIQNATDVARPPSTDRRQPDRSTANNHHRSTDTITHQSTTA